MKTLISFIFGLLLSLLATHYYHHVKTEYFDALYSHYTIIDFNHLTRQQFEKKWLAQQPWCFSTPEQSYCNASATPRENKIIPKNQLVSFHQKLINWYPKARSFLYELQNWIVDLWEKQSPRITGT